ncbi:hypothetical protein T484DRAFT_1797900 [Baffinella frigidus]|nr:hypothetical protein T484DRAFT_1797900 [Cryptophyta sp. CCMP2293]
MKGAGGSCEGNVRVDLARATVDEVRVDLARATVEEVKRLVEVQEEIPQDQQVKRLVEEQEEISQDQQVCAQLIV